MDFSFDLDVAHGILDGLGTFPGDDDSVLERAARVVWNHLTEPGDGVAGRVIEALGSAGALSALEKDGNGEGSGEFLSVLTQREHRDCLRRWLPRLSLQGIHDSGRRARHSGVTLVMPGDQQWPAGLDDLGDHSPLCLWVRGDTERLVSSRPQVAIVGARAATSYGEHVALELAADLVSTDITIISGGAYGIDGAAHRAALSAGGTTIALLAGGVDRAYPAGHTQLLERIAQTGALASEVPPGSTPTKWRFLQRNRLIAAMATVTVVVEAGWRSGSLNTAGHAAELARPIGAVPGPITSAASSGCHRLLQEFGAYCVTSGADVRSMLGMDASLAVRDGGDARRTR
ncbi:DNA-processing protein DprA (plasmid) [Coraliomargarita sp. W4R53]